MDFFIGLIVGSILGIILAVIIVVRLGVMYFLASLGKGDY